MTLPPSFPMENKKEVRELCSNENNIIVDKDTEKYVNNVINANIPKENKQNHVLVEGVGSEKDYSYSFYNPHNARYYFNFDKWNFNKKGSVGVGFEIINSKELLLKNYYGCRIVIKKSQIEITNKIDTKRLFKIEGNADNKRLLVAEANAVLEREVIKVLRCFVNEFGGTTDFVVKKVWIADNKIFHDRVIDSLPSKLSFRNDVVKKVYLEEPSNVEYSESVHASNYFRNMGLFDYGEEILKELKNVKDERFEFSKALALYTEQINLHLKVEERQLIVQDETLKTLKAIKESVSINKKDRVRSLLSEYGW